MFNNLLRVGVLCASAVFVSGCTTIGNLRNGLDFSPVTTFSENAISAVASTAWHNQKLGIKALEEGALENASVHLNMALKLNTRSSELHFLNGLAYHQRAKSGNDAMYPLAEMGYQMALKFDPSNWRASYLLGQIKFEKGDYASAQELIAEASLYQPDNPTVLHDLAVASYYARDINLASSLFKYLADAIEPVDYNLAGAAITSAAIGNKEQADKYVDELWKLSKIKADAPANRKGTEYTSPLRVHRRVSDWIQFLDYAETLPVELPDLKTANDKAVVNQAEDDNNMVAVDVVLLSSEDTMSGSKGINILNGLQLQFGADADSTSGLSWKTVTSKTDVSASTTITKAINIPAITYSLNIVNASTDSARVLASPTVIATFGEESKFFSGLEIDVTAVGGSRADGEVFNKTKEIGVSLTMSPEKTEDGRLKINVGADRTFLTTPNTTSVTYSLRIDTSKTSLNASVIMDYDQTLILAGLDDKQSIFQDNSVPGLGSVPLVGAAFSEKYKNAYQKSVIILMTPRKPTFQDRQSADYDHNEQSSSVNEYKNRYVKQFDVGNTNESLFWRNDTANEQVARREFRHRDLLMRPFDIGQMLDPL